MIIPSPILILYVWRRMMHSVGLVAAVFFCLFLSLGLFTYANSEQALTASLPIILVDALRLLAMFSSSILFFGMLLCLRNLIQKSEMIAIMAMGLTARQLTLMFVIAMLTIGLIWAAAMEGVLPLLSRYEKQYSLNLTAQQNQIASLQRSGKWLRSNNTFMRIEKNLGNQINGIKLLQFNQRNQLQRPELQRPERQRFELERIIRADSGLIVADGLHLQQAKIIDLQYPANDHFSTITTTQPISTVSSPTWLKPLNLQYLPTWLAAVEMSTNTIGTLQIKLELNQQVFDYFDQQADEFYIWQLWQYIDYLDDHFLMDNQGKLMHFQFWQRLLFPLELVGLLLIVLPSMQSSPRVKPMERVWLASTSLGFLVQLLSELLKSATAWVNDWHVILAFILPLTLLSVGLWRCTR